MHRGGPLVGLTVCDQGQSLASSASQSGTVFVVRIESNSSKMSVIGTRQLDLQVTKFSVTIDIQCKKELFKNDHYDQF